ncbi:hypothetical protein JY651_35520 [Pyxidicoccus parkwayensis]|uniref:Uncharacterized protein n=1 Tax=Pyxidicoccus parkwayensis TaxID=2813578 RepID=A0ABX7NPZ9_9BACT|nr:hypothetical protein [Pyxidicoccus parkwaysis]QSQ20518.1 hypothetical protein JY651_35520 [Pyxidicoccus parkwaysis]
MPWRLRRPSRGALNPRTAAITFTMLQVLSLGRVPGTALARARTRRGLAFAALGGATLRLLGKRLRRRSGWVPRARQALKEPVEAALAMAMLGALSLPLMVEPPAEPEPAHGRAPVPPGGTRKASVRSQDDDGEDGDDLDFNGAIASW